MRQTIFSRREDLATKMGARTSPFSCITRLDQKDRMSRHPSSASKRKPIELSTSLPSVQRLHRQSKKRSLVYHYLLSGLFFKGLLSLFSQLSFFLRAGLTKTHSLGFPILWDFKISTKIKDLGYFWNSSRPGSAKVIILLLLLLSLFVS